MRSRPTPDLRNGGQRYARPALDRAFQEAVAGQTIAVITSVSAGSARRLLEGAQRWMPRRWRATRPRFAADNERRAPGMPGGP